MDSLYRSEREKVLELTNAHVLELTRIWSAIFHENDCRENLQKLASHANNFYEELLAESYEKKVYIENEISLLREEAENLGRLLKTEVQLPTYEDDLPLLVVQSEMDKSLFALRECLRERREQICELLLEQDTLCDELGESPRQLLDDPLPSGEEIEEFREHLDKLREIRVERINKLGQMRRDIKNFLQILDLKVNTERDDRLLNHRQIKLNNETFTGLQRLYDSFSEQAKELQERIDGTRNKLEGLWDRLKTSPSVRNRFNKYTDYTQKTYDIMYAELHRCEQLKKQNIKQYIDQIREDIKHWWDKCLISEVERNRFTHLHSSCFNDDLLTLHEMELEDLKTFYETNHKIYELYADRKILWDRMNALESKASEPGRYNNRGGQLLREEKERKTIANKLPRIEKQIADLVEEFENKEHMPFLVNGQNIRDVMFNDWERKRQEKEKNSTARKQGQTPLPKGPGSYKRTPMSMKNMSTMSSMRRTPSANNLSAMPATTTQKRKLAAAEKHTPVAKRSLMHALNSPSVFLKPGNQMGKAQNKVVKRTRVIASAIARQRLSGQHNKRRSINKSHTVAHPKIVVTNQSGTESDFDTDEAYDSFQRRIEPASRSSVVLHNSTTIAASQNKRNQRRENIASKENSRLARLPIPRPMRSPIKQNHRAPSAHSPLSVSTLSSRKLTTKNLPIII